LAGGGAILKRAHLRVSRYVEITPVLVRPLPKPEWKCFENNLRVDLVDREAFKFNHRLLGHPTLTLENLARALPLLPEDQVMYSKGLLSNGDDFEGTFKSKPKDRSLQQTIEEIRATNSYIMVRAPEAEVSFAGLKQDLLEDTESIIRERRVGKRAVDAELYMFIASPNSVTPFHIDRNSTFLMQFRGTKTVHVFPQWDERVVTARDTEAYIAFANTKLPWSPNIDALCTPFTFSPGEALHIPFVSGHHVRNGADDVSITMSIIFNTDQSVAWRDALAFNHKLRKVLSLVGAQPSAIGTSRWRDGAKAQLQRVWEQRRRR